MELTAEEVETIEALRARRARVVLVPKGRAS